MIFLILITIWIVFLFVLVVTLLVMRTVGILYAEPKILKVNELLGDISEEVLFKKKNYEDFLEMNDFSLKSILYVKWNERYLKGNIMLYLNSDKSILAFMTMNKNTVYITYETNFINNLKLNLSNIKSSSTNKKAIFIYKKLPLDKLLEEHLRISDLIDLEKVIFDNIEDYFSDSIKEGNNLLIEKKMYIKSGDFLYPKLRYNLKKLFTLALIKLGVLNTSNSKLLKKYSKN